MTNLERRNFIQSAGLLAGAAQPRQPDRAARIGAERADRNQPMIYEAKPLSLDPKSIKGISEKVMVSHYENNYVGAVKRPQRDRAPNSPNWILPKHRTSSSTPEARRADRGKLDDPA